MHKNLQKTSIIGQKFDSRMTYIPFHYAPKGQALGKRKTSRRTELKKQTQSPVFGRKSLTLNPTSKQWRDYAKQTQFYFPRTSAK